MWGEVHSDGLRGVSRKLSTQYVCMEHTSGVQLQLCEGGREGECEGGREGGREDASYVYIQ